MVSTGKRGGLGAGAGSAPIAPKGGDPTAGVIEGLGFFSMVILLFPIF
jgi:hypothetical protein